MLLAKQHRTGLQIGYSPFCKADSAEVSALMRWPAAVDFAPLALYPELEELWIDELPWETTEIKNVEQLYAMPKLKNLSIWDKQMPGWTFRASSLWNRCKPTPPTSNTSSTSARRQG